MNTPAAPTRPRQHHCLNTVATAKKTLEASVDTIARLGSMMQMHVSPDYHPFDVHALYFSEDAVALENQLHEAFADRRLNHVNTRREFFFATPQQVRDVLAEKVGSLLEFAEAPEATEYFQSRGRWPHPIRRAGKPTASTP